MNDPFKAGSIAYLIICGLIAIGLAMLSGCSTTEYAKITAYGVHAISPYGVLSLGVLEYERAARPEGEHKPEIWMIPQAPEQPQLEKPAASKGGDAV